jgi:hypothetical protein
MNYFSQNIQISLVIIVYIAQICHIIYISMPNLEAISILASICKEYSNFVFLAGKRFSLRSERVYNVKCTSSHDCNYILWSQGFPHHDTHVIMYNFGVK